MMCRSHGIPYTPEGGRYLIEKWYRPKSRHFRGCQPRDITDLLIDIASFRGQQPAFTPEWIDLACSSYFIEELSAPR